MRVTNSMLKSNLMRNLHLNFNRSDKLQNQMSTGRKFANISDDPTALIYSQAARNKMARLSHFQRTTQTAKSWLTQAENSMKELQDVLVNAYEAAVDASTDGKTAADKQNIAQVIGQLRDHYIDTLNSTFGNNFVFSGYNTPGDAETNLFDKGIKPFTLENGNIMYNGFNLSQFDKMSADFLNVNLSGMNFINGTINPANPMEGSQADLALQSFLAGLGHATPADFTTNTGIDYDQLLMLHRLRGDVLKLDVGPGISMSSTFNGIDMVLFPGMNDLNQPIVRSAYDVLNELYNATMTNMPASDLTKMIRPIQEGQNHLLMRIAEVGGRTRRLELLEARYEQDQINNRQMLSDAEDVDMAVVIMELRMAEAVMQASMAAGARIIQPSLMDFLR